MTRIATITAIAMALLAAATAILWYQGRASGVPEGLVWGNGRVEGTELRVTAKYAGRVTEVLAKEGDEVAKGQVLIRFDDRERLAQLAEAKAQMQRAYHGKHAANAEKKRRRSELDFLSAKLKRSQKLALSGHVSEQQIEADRSKRDAAAAAVDNADALAIEADAEYQAAQARVERSRAIVSETVLSAPSTGRILYRMTEPGEIVPAGGVVMVIVDLDRLFMTVYVPERQAGQVKVGADAVLRIDAYPKRLFDAKVSLVADKAEFTPKEVETREEREKLVFRVKLRVGDNSDRTLKPGMPGEAWIRTAGASGWPPKLD